MTQPIKIAILAMGGEGGGVLADWLVDLAEHNGHLAQTTSVPGVAQRTGATIYYVELFAEQAARDAGAVPVLALMPLPGDVDVVLASELMEAARAVQRGLVTTERTTLVASTHRVYALAEKVVPGDGRADADALLAQARAAARRFIGFDMERAAADSGSVVSAVLFGALAASGALPFERAQFEATIERGGVGVQASLRAFSSAFGLAASGPPLPPAAAPFVLPRAAHAGVQALIERAAQAHRGPALPLVIEGLRRLIDYQDLRYAALYLDRIDAVPAVEGDPASGVLCSELARHLALWMSYEDSFRVADLKTRGERFERLRRESGAATGELLTIHDYLHPRVQEVADALPAALGRWLLASGAARRLVERFAARGRVVPSSSLRGYLLLSTLAALRRWRRGSLRHRREDERIDAWLADVRETAARDVALATEIVRCQRLVKGYGDTHERGWVNFERLRACWRRDAAPLAAATLAELRDAALADEQGRALQAALQRHGLG